MTLISAISLAAAAVAALAVLLAELISRPEARRSTRKTNKYTVYADGTYCWGCGRNEVYMYVDEVHPMRMCGRLFLMHEYRCSFCRKRWGVRKETKENSHGKQNR